MAVRRDEEASFAPFYFVPQLGPNSIDPPVKSARLSGLVALAPQVQAHGATARALQALRDGLSGNQLLSQVRGQRRVDGVK